MMSQKDGTFNVVKTVLNDFKREINPTEQVVLSSEERAGCIQRLCSMLENKTIFTSKNYNESGRKTYAGGLLSNWLKKDRRLNGDIEFQLKNPGSRANNTTPEIIELKKLHKHVKGTEDESKVKSMLDDKVTEHRQSRQMQAIDITLIPAELQDLVS